MSAKPPSRREILGQVSMAAIGGVLGASAVDRLAGMAVAEEAVPDNPLQSDKKIRVGVVGGGFGRAFQWHEHPNCIVHAVSDLRKDRREKLIQTYRCELAYESLEKLILDKDIDAVAVFTEAPNHARHVIACMQAGKHVISAVPTCLTLEEAEQIKTVKQKTGLKYMMAETSYYRRHGIAARKLYQDGAFGNLFYTEAEYYHPGIGQENDGLSWYKGKRTWRHGFPPMWYPTHSTSFLVGTTGERLTEVSCLGWREPSEEAWKNNAYDNPFSSNMGLFKTSGGNMCRAGVFWDGQSHGERAQWFGTKMTYYMPGSFGGMRIIGPGAPQWTDVPNFYHLLPKPLRHASGHGDSHSFITHEFIAALVEDREPAIDLYESLAITVPGLVAHESALKDGEQLKIPNFDPA